MLYAKHVTFGYTSFVTDHQQNQRKIIENLEQLFRQNTGQVSVVAPVEDFLEDKRITLTSIHIPSDSLKAEIQESIIKPLKKQFPDIHFYSNDSLHLTIKNVRVVSDPPNFDEEQIKVVNEVFTSVLARHKKFTVNFYKLFLTQNSIALVGTTDPHLDDIIIDLDTVLKERGMEDDKKYVNKKYFFCNITLARFSTPVTDELERTVRKLSDKLVIEPYVVDSVNLVSGNAVMNYLQIHGRWDLL